VGVIFLEYRRNERNAGEKKRKEDEFRQRLDDAVHRDREVNSGLELLEQWAHHVHFQLHACVQAPQSSGMTAGNTLWRMTTSSVLSEDVFYVGAAIRNAAVTGVLGRNAAAA
jgi:hypothetical protein